MGLVVAELETRFTGNTKPFEASATKVEKDRAALAKAKTEVKVTADTKGAEAGMDRVEGDAKRLSAKDVLVKVDANIASATTKADKIRGDLAVLEATDTTPEVDADIAKARKALDSVESSLKSLQGTRAKLEVIADTQQAESALDDVAGKAADAGTKGGEDAGKGLSGGIIAALATIPIAGAVIGIGAAIGKSLMDGLQVEVRSDILTARTGLDEETVARVARAAGEAYAGNFGESLEGNMDTARLAIQGGLLDPDDTVRDTQKIISSLSAVADIIGEDIARVSRSTAQLIRTGLAKDSAEAFDIIVKGQQAGLNVSEDWLDTLDEYSTQFRVLGLDGPAAMGLLSQAVQAGARDTDTAADALKEFAIRAVDGSKLTAESYDAIGLSAEDMAARVIAGGPTSAAALEETLVKLREMEPGAERTAAAVGLFGTKAEDLGDALYAMDLTTAIDQLGTVAGVAQTAVDALGDNAAGSIASAQRNIEVAADGIKGALATAFNPQIEGFATFVAENREAVITFLLEIANGGLDMGRSIVNGVASGTEAVGAFISGPIADLIEAMGDLAFAVDDAMIGDQGGLAARDGAQAMAESLRGVEGATSDLADEMRENLITNGIDPAQEKLNAIAIPMIAQAAVHDASMRLAQSIDTVGYAADGTTRLVDGLTVAADGTATASTELDAQLQAVAAALADETEKGRLAGDTQTDLTARYEEGRQALILQLEQMGLTTEQAETLAASYGAVPGTVATTFLAETAAAQTQIDQYIARNTGRIVQLKAEVSATTGNTIYVTATGARMEAAGDVLSMRPMGKRAAVVPPGTLRVIGDRMDVDESFIPHDGSARSLSILDETMRRMLGYGIAPMADGGVVTAGAYQVVGQQAVNRAPTLAGLAIEGTLDLGGGLVGVMRGVVKAELSDAGSRARYAGGS